MGSFWKKIPDRKNFHTLRHGFSFAEKCAGTNGIALSLLLHKPAWTLPRQNYCSLLSRSALYCVLLTQMSPSPALAVVTTGRPSPDWVLSLLCQMSYGIALGCRQERRCPGPAYANKPFTERQRMVLLRIAQGMKDQAIALDLHVSLDTVRYHKKNIYRMLGVSNSIEMLVRALKGGLVSLDEVSASI